MLRVYAYVGVGTCHVCALRGGTVNPWDPLNRLEGGILQVGAARALLG